MDDTTLSRIATFLDGLCNAEELEDRLSLGKEDEATQGLEKSLNAFLDKLWVKGFQLQAKQEMLEQVVQIRTKEVHEILDNVATGFLIALRDGSLLDNYSRSCAEIFKEASLKGKKLTELLRFDARAADNWTACYEQIFEDFLPAELSLDQLPHEFAIEGRTYRIEGSPLRNADGRVARIFFTVTDTTELRHAERDNALRRALLEIVSQKESFQAFLFETRQALEEARASGKQHTLRRVLHTVKGNLGCYGLHEIAGLVHAIEDQLTLSVGDVDKVEDTLRKFVSVNRAILGFDYPMDGRPARSIEIDQLVPFLRGLAEDDSIESRRVLVAGFVEKLTWVPARALLAPLSGVVARGAERLEKEVEFALEGGDILIDAAWAGGVLANLGHLVRNSLDHGIEPPDQRGEKSPRGRIVVRCVETDDEWSFEVEDDGRGVDVDKVVRVAIERNVVTDVDVASMSEQERLRLLFSDGVSTADAVTTLSGRGVGTAALLDSVEERHGSVQVSTRLGEGTKFEVHVPRPHTALPQLHAGRRVSLTFPPMWGPLA